MTGFETGLERAAWAWAAAGAGGLLAVSARGAARRHLSLLTGMAAAALLLVTLGDILPDAHALAGWPLTLVGAVTGAGLLWAVSRLVHPVCPACAGPENAMARGSLDRTARFLMVALAFHCLLDGAAVALPGAGEGGPDAPLFGAVLLHKVPEGLALALLLIGAGRSASASFFLTLLTESATLAGGLLGELARGPVPAPVLGFLLAHVGGGFLFLVGMTVGSLSAQGTHAAPQNVKRIPPLPLDTEN